MSRSHEFYSIAWNDLRTAIGGRDKRLFRAVLKTVEDEFEEIFEPEDFEDGVDYEQGIEHWIEGTIAKQAREPHRIDNLGEALGFVAFVKHFGVMVGTLNHSSAGVELYHDRFFERAVPRLLRATFPMEYLISRPIVGYQSADFPLWGGLSENELEALAMRLGEDPPIYVEDPEVDVWVPELWSALGSALDGKKDLITVYW